MDTSAQNLPDPSTEAVSLWIKQLSRAAVHDNGWLRVNGDLHGIAKAVRPFILQSYTPAEQEAAFDGLTLGLMAILHFNDLRQLDAELNVDGPPVSELLDQIPDQTVSKDKNTPA